MVMYLLKNRGIRRPSERPDGIVLPKLGVPACCRGRVMVGFMVCTSCICLYGQRGNGYDIMTRILVNVFTSCAQGFV